MATKHASSGELIDLRPLGAPLDDSKSTTLLRDEQLKVMRLVMPTGKELLGTAGGIGLIIGPAGLFWLILRRHPLHGDPAQRTMDRGFIALLFFTSLTGLVLLAARDTGAMGLLLAVHLGFVMAMFLVLPYSNSIW